MLAAAGIEHRLANVSGGWRLVVAEADGDAASAALDAYETERAIPAPPAAPAPPYPGAVTGVHVAALLMAFYLLTGPAITRSTWFRIGSSTADRVLAGEPWRAVTGLTLHADAAHAFGNAVACAIFVTAVARELGPGLGIFLVLVTGVGGNVVNAVVRGAPHSAVGASTAIFGAIGILGGLQWGRRHGQPRAWIAIAGSMALLALLGTGERSDILAHLFGFAVGLVIGAVVARLGPPPGLVLQVILGATAAAVVVVSWLAAFGIV